MTMTLIESHTLTSSASSLDMFSIPSNYTDLYLVISARNTTTGNRQVLLQFNGDGLNHTSRRLFGNGLTATSEASTNVAAIISGFGQGSDSTSNTFNNMSFYITNYTSSNFKSVSIDSVSENNGPTAYQTVVAGIYNSTSAINRISMYTDSGNYAAGTSFHLYGVTKA